MAVAVEMALALAAMAAGIARPLAAAPAVSAARFELVGKPFEQEASGRKTAVAAGLPLAALVAQPRQG